MGIFRRDNSSNETNSGVYGGENHGISGGVHHGNIRIGGGTSSEADRRRAESQADAALDAVASKREADRRRGEEQADAMMAALWGRK